MVLMLKIARALVCLSRSLFPASLLLNIATLCVDCLVITHIGLLSFLSSPRSIPPDYGAPASLRKYFSFVTVTHFAPALCYCYNCRDP